MKFSLLTASCVLAFVAAVGASQNYGGSSYNSKQNYGGNSYNSNQNYGENSHNSNQNYGGNSYGNNQNSYQLNERYAENGCGYDCRNTLSYQQPGARSAYGPYHSYAVRPAIYGGHGMYHYKGYARHPLPPSNAHYRIVRAYSAPQSHHRQASYPTGGHSANYQAPANYQASNNHHNQQYNSMRPVKVLVLAPAYSGNSNYATRGAAPSGHNGAYRGARSYGGYNSGSGQASGARHYGAGAGNTHYNRQYQSDASRYNQGGSRHYSSSSSSSSSSASAGGY